MGCSRPLRSSARAGSRDARDRAPATPRHAPPHPPGRLLRQRPTPLDAREVPRRHEGHQRRPEPLLGRGPLAARRTTTPTVRSTSPSPRAAHARVPGVIVHRTRRDPQVIRLDAIPVTTPARALIDLSSMQSFTPLRRAVREGFALKRVTLDELRGQTKTPRRGPRPGLRPHRIRTRGRHPRPDPRPLRATPGPTHPDPRRHPHPPRLPLARPQPHRSKPTAPSSTTRPSPVRTTPPNRPASRPTATASSA